MSSCEIKIPSAEGLPESELTVGRTFELSCSGLTVPADFKSDKAQFVLDEKNEYAIKNLQTLEATATTLRMKVAAYRVGDWKFDEIKVTDSASTVSLGSVQYSVHTVMPQDQTVNDPYGPMGPMPISIPWFYFAIAIGLVVALVLQVSLYFRRRWQRQTLLQRSQSHFLTGDALHQFHFYARQWQRKYSFFNEATFVPADLKSCLDEIDFQLRIYLVRSFQIPALEWSARLILKDLKKINSEVFDSYGSGLKKILIEVNKMKSKPDSIQPKDVIQILDQSRRWVEKVDLIIQSKEPFRQGGN